MAVIRLTSRLWREYLRANRIKASKKAAENRLRKKRETLIVEHMPLAAKIARQVWHRFNRGCGVTVEGHARNGGGAGYAVPIALEDMVSCAYLGLVEAAGRWDPSKGDFQKYCYLRVRGAIVDAHRRQHYLELQHDSVDEWLELDTTGEEGGIKDWAQDGHRGQISKYLSDPHPLADEVVNAKELRLVAAVAIDRILPDDERAVIRGALAGGSLSSIAEDMGHAPAWARAKLIAAREKVAAAVQRKAA